MNQELFNSLLIILAGTIAIFSYIYKLRLLSHEERKLEIKSDIERVQPYVNAWLIRSLPLWIIILLGLGGLTFVTVKYTNLINENANEIIIDNDGNPIILGSSGKPLVLRFPGATSPAGDASNVFFGCVWPTTGHSDVAVQDCGTNDWAGEPSYSNGASDTVFVVKSASGLDFPTTNVLGVVANGDAGALWITTTENYVPATAVESGDTISRRFYFRVTAPNTGEDNTHATHDGATTNNEDHNTSIEQYDLNTSSTWVPEILHGPSGAGRVAFRLTGGRTLNKNTTYIYRDWVVIGSTTSVLRVQIYDSSGSLLYDVDDFAASQGSGTNMSTGISANFGASNGATGYRQFQLGINGFNPPASTSFAYYYGAFVICSGLCPIEHIPGEGQP